MRNLYHYNEVHPPLYHVWTKTGGGGGRGISYFPDIIKVWKIFLLNLPIAPAGDHKNASTGEEMGHNEAAEQYTNDKIKIVTGSEGRNHKECSCWDLADPKTIIQ